MVKSWSCYMPGCKSKIARNTPSEINRHLKTHTPRETWEYQCPHPGCGFASTQEINYKIHRKIHDKASVGVQPNKRRKPLDNDLQAAKSSMTGEVLFSFTEVTNGSLDAYEEQQETRAFSAPFPVSNQPGVAAGSADGIDTLVSNRAKHIGLGTAVGTVISHSGAEMYEPCYPTSTPSNGNYELLRSYVLDQGAYPKPSLMENVLEGDPASYFGHSEVTHVICKRDPSFCTLVGNDNNPATLCEQKYWGPVPEVSITLRPVSLSDWMAQTAEDLNDSDHSGPGKAVKHESSKRDPPQRAPILPVSDNSKLPPRIRQDLFKHANFWNAA